MSTTMNPNKALREKGDFTRIAATMRESGEASLEAQPPADVHPDAVEAMLASVPDLSDALADYEPPELAMLLEDFDVEVTYNKHERTLQLAATLELDRPPETARPPHWAVAQM